MNSESQFHCPDCDDGISRRDFAKVIGGAAAAAGSVGLLGTSSVAQAAPTPKSAAETTVKRFYETISDEQKKVICFPFNHQLRKKLNANWAITKPEIGSDFYTETQRKLIDQILREVSSEEGYEKFHKQMKGDQDGGFNQFHVAVFGKPGSGKFEWELTGRHLTLRADGDNVKNMAFGGPVVYGHGESDPKKNVYHYQTKKANEVFKALDVKQVEQALLETAPDENNVPLQGKNGTFPGVAVGDLSSDQKDLVEKTIKVILAPYREEDVDEVLSILKKGGGLNKLHMAFYQEDDLNKDEVWDIWRMEGPTFVWHFRGAPHVHTYVNIGTKKA
jgi:hypothetical protein